MYSQKRIPKRSILGTRVSAPWSDGRFYCGVVESMTEQPNGQFMYSVLFDDGYSKRYFYKDIVGPGFSTISGLYLKHGQKVYITHQGRELSGVVVKHNRATNEVLVEIEGSGGDIFETVKRLDDIRLMESRKSARLNSSPAPSDGDKGHSQHIDVPRNKIRSNRRKKTVDDMIAEESEDGNESLDIDSDMQLAAMALQNLSCSPASPHFPACGLSKSPHSWNDRSGSRLSPSPPPNNYSLSAPIHSFFGSASTDEGIEVEDTMYPMDDVIIFKRRKGDDAKPTCNSIRYKCTWKGCSVVEDDCYDIEKHIRDAHLGPREDDLSDHEEDFYYEEIEETAEMDEMTATMEVMTCASPTQSSPLNLSLPRPPKQEVTPKPTGQDHEYNKRELLLLQQLNDQKSPPILIPGALPVHHKMQPSPSSAYIVPQNSPYSRQILKTGSPLSPTTSSPKHTLGPARKSRSDIKKCRKVYGMENRDRWCTQCRWKKACTRFVPEVNLS